ncbi:hypothetical protein ES332_D03G146900v1 [Gossypium tomentosum]|uniref:Uncharacterized protein n=1 Tax=Gossypium tomentosum TaxID=34277 RepID=A0A5D2LMG8_GOSTO|nr:hypothetical protein ES332_D03G146900v1 [Gossypium tomentosum]
MNLCMNGLKKNTYSIIESQGQLEIQVGVHTLSVLQIVRSFDNFEIGYKWHVLRAFKFFYLR